MPSLMRVPSEFYLRGVDGVENLLEGFGVAFTSPGLRDFFGQYFTGRTDFGRDKFPFSFPRKGNWRHNRAGRRGDIGQTHSIELRDRGLWLTIELDTDNEHYPEYRDRGRAGDLAFSIETMPNWYRIAADGHVDYFPFVGWSLTDQATAPAGLTRVQALRDLGVDMQGEPEDEIVTIGRGPLDVEWPIVTVEPVVNERSVPSFVTQSSRRLPSTPPTPPPAVVHERDIKDPLDRFSLDDMVSQVHFAGSAFRDYPKYHRRALLDKFVALMVEDQRKPRAERTFLQRVPGDGKSQAALSDYEVFADVVNRPLDQYGYIRSQDFHFRDDEVDYSTLASFGDAVVATMKSMLMWRNIRLQTRVFGLFESFRMPSNPYEYPRVTSNIVTRKGTELNDQAELVLSNATKYILQKQGRDNVTFTCLGVLEAYMVWSDELSRWASIDMVGEASKEFDEAFRRGADWLVLNGDEGADVNNISHLGADPTATVYDRVLLAGGLRFACVDVAGREVDNAASALQASDFVVARALMGSLGLDVERLVHIHDVNLAFDMMTLTEMKTLDVYGPEATIRTGEVGKIFGVAAIPSEELELTNGDGMIEDSHDTTASSFLTVHLDTWKIGMGFPYSIERFRQPGVRGDLIRGEMGFDIQNFQAAGTAYSFDLP